MNSLSYELAHLNQFLLQIDEILIDSLIKQLKKISYFQQLSYCITQTNRETN